GRGARRSRSAPRRTSPPRGTRGIRGGARRAGGRAAPGSSTPGAWEPHALPTRGGQPGAMDYRRKRSLAPPGSEPGAGSFAETGSVPAARAAGAVPGAPLAALRRGAACGSGAMSAAAASGAPFAAKRYDARRLAFSGEGPVRGVATALLRARDRYSPEGNVIPSSTR